MNTSPSIEALGLTIHTDDEGRYSLNDLHKLAMSRGFATASQKPGNFLRLLDIKQYINQLSDASQIRAVKVINGNNGGTYATRLVALRYAAWVSKEFEVAVYDTFDKVSRKDEGLTASLIEGQTDPAVSARLAARAQGKVVRHALTDTLQEHGVKSIGFATCTNAIYQHLLGGTAKQLRQKSGLPAKTNIRETLNRRDLVSVMFAEELSIKHIEDRNAQGNDACADQCGIAALKVKSIL